MSESYLTPEQKIRQRHSWFLEAERLGNVHLACLRMGISRKTFYKWKRRFLEAQGDRSALLDRPRRPHHSRRWVKKGLIRRILALRERTRLGPLRLRQLLLNHGAKRIPSAFTLSKILKRAGLTRKRRVRPKRYRRSFLVPRPGEVLQVDIKYVPYRVEGRRLYQYTAIDCCTRLRIVQFSQEMANHVSKTFILSLPGENRPDRQRHPLHELVYGSCQDSPGSSPQKPSLHDGVRAVRGHPSPDPTSHSPLEGQGGTEPSD